jgi:hypothetical protein
MKHQRDNNSDDEEIEANANKRTKYEDECTKCNAEKEIATQCTKCKNNYCSDCLVPTSSCLSCKFEICEYCIADACHYCKKYCCSDCEESIEQCSQCEHRSCTECIGSTCLYCECSFCADCESFCWHCSHCGEGICSRRCFREFKDTMKRCEDCRKSVCEHCVLSCGCDQKRKYQSKLFEWSKVEHYTDVEIYF